MTNAPFTTRLTHFSRLLRENGITQIGPRECSDALTAMRTIDPMDRAVFRLALRTTLTKSREHQDTFDRLFDAFWVGRPEESSRQTAAGPEKDTDNDKGEIADGHRGNAVSDRDPSSIDDTPPPGGDNESYSPAAIASARRFEDFTADEMPELLRMIRRIARSLATRRNRKYRVSRHGRHVAFRHMFRRQLGHGGDIVELAYRHRRRHRLQLVILCDVSQSMESYTRFLVQFIHALQRVSQRTETFLFSTSLQRVTPIMRGHNFESELEAAAAEFPEWSGGTRIGECLEEFVDDYGHTLLTSRTVVIIMSDGWDTGHIRQLERSMDFIQRRAKQVIWLNPLLGMPNYEPTCRGMKAALPFIDTFAPIHNLESLRHLARILAT